MSDSTIPNSRLPKSLFTLLPEELGTERSELADFMQIDIQEETTAAAEESIKKAIFSGKRRNSDGIPIPLTEAEAKAADAQIEQTLARIESTRTRINQVRDIIDESVGKTGELNFKLDISKKGSYKRAIKALYGYKTDTITYSMYKEMLRAKALLEKQEGKDYYEGKFEDPEEDDEKDKKEKD